MPHVVVIGGMLKTGKIVGGPFGGPVGGGQGPPLPLPQLEGTPEVKRPLAPEVPWEEVAGRSAVLVAPWVLPDGALVECPAPPLVPELD